MYVTTQSGQSGSGGGTAEGILSEKCEEVYKSMTVGRVSVQQSIRVHIGETTVTFNSLRVNSG